MIPSHEQIQNARPTVYIAAPLFNTAERSFNTDLKRKLKPYFDVYLPQEDGLLMSKMIESGIHPTTAARKVFHDDICAIRACDIILIILDGRVVDEGASFELGYAYANGKACYGLKTDYRQFNKNGENPMISVPLQHIFASVDDLLLWAKESKTRPYCPALEPLSERNQASKVAQC